MILIPNFPSNQFYFPTEKKLIKAKYFIIKY